MKYLISIMLCFGFVFCKGQKSTVDTALPVYTAKSLFINHAPSFPEKDTVKCWFYEVLDSNSDIFKWTSGYVIRHEGFINFEAFSGYPTMVQPPYLPITDGIITSPLFYSNMDSVKNKAIKIVLKQ